MIRHDFIRTVAWIATAMILLPGRTAVTSASQREAPAEPSVALENGLVLTAGAFVSRDLYVKDGRFVTERPAGDIRVIDLGGRHVIPPLGDAHTHRFSRAADATDSRELYLERGYLYVANLCCPPDARSATSRHANRADSLDVLFTNGAFTCTDGHPIALYQSLHRRRGGTEATFAETYQDRTFHVVDTSEDINRKWPVLLATRPDLVKIILSDCERHQNPVLGLTSDGIRPDLVPLIVAHARNAGLRVVAHVNTAEDFRVAVRAGVDLAAHMPGFGARAGEDEDRYRLTPADGVEAAAAGIAVITTAGAYDDRTDNSTARAVVTHNLEVLRGAGVTILFGSDDWFGPDKELSALTAIGIAPAELLDIMTRTTPRRLFPGRSIGELSPGHEASLVVVADDPLADIAAITSVRLVMKRGRILLSRLRSAPVDQSEGRSQSE